MCSFWESRPVYGTWYIHSYIEVFDSTTYIATIKIVTSKVAVVVYILFLEAISAILLLASFS